MQYPKSEIHPLFRESKRPRYYSDMCEKMATQKAIIFLNHNGYPGMKYHRVKVETVVQKFFEVLGLTPPDPKTTNVKHRLMDLYLMDLWPFFAYDYGFLRSEEWKEAREKTFAHYGRVCAKCGATEHLHIDHIKPKSHYPGLRLDLSNLQVLCAKCNMSKGNRNRMRYTRGGVAELAAKTVCDKYAALAKKKRKAIKIEPGQSKVVPSRARPYIKKSLERLKKSKKSWKNVMDWFFVENCGKTPIYLLASKQYELYESLYLS